MPSTPAVARRPKPGVRDGTGKLGGKSKQEGVDGGQNIIPADSPASSIIDEIVNFAFDINADRARANAAFTVAAHAAAFTAFCMLNSAFLKVEMPDTESKATTASSKITNSNENRIKTKAKPGVTENIHNNKLVSAHLLPYSIDSRENETFYQIPVPPPPGIKDALAPGSIEVIPCSTSIKQQLSMIDHKNRQTYRKKINGDD